MILSPPCPSLKRAVLAVLGGAALHLAGNPAHAADITLPPETARYVESPLPGYPLATALCSTCHSADYVRTQPPRLPRTFWTATVAKMQKTFGATIPADSVDPLVDFLVKTYGAERPSQPAPASPNATNEGQAGKAPPRNPRSD